jgi:hypothetical protein
MYRGQAIQENSICSSGYKFIHTDEYPHVMNIASYIHRLTDEYMCLYIRQLIDEYTLIDECTR